jgi:hypothetical protein
MGHVIASPVEKRIRESLEQHMQQLSVATASVKHWSLLVAALLMGV